MIQSTVWSCMFLLVGYFGAGAGVWVDEFARHGMRIEKLSWIRRTWHRPLRSR
jgi:hypothetical protein